MRRSEKMRRARLVAALVQFNEDIERLMRVVPESEDASIPDRLLHILGDSKLLVVDLIAAQWPEVES